jgi:hypothetical protein
VPDRDGWWVDLLLAHAGSGEVLNLAGDDPSPDPAAWPDDRRIPAAALRAALVQLRDPTRSDPRGLRIVGADVTGRLDLDHLQLPCPLRLDHCRLRHGLSLDFAHVRTLHLAGSQLGSDQARPPLALRGATIAGQLVLAGASLSNPGGHALSLEGATIGGGASLRRCTVAGEVRAVSTTVGGQLTLDEATLRHEGGAALVLDGATVRGGASLRGCAAVGQVRAVAATITGHLVLTGATLTSTGRPALSLDRATVDGGAYLDGCTVAGQVRAAGATITGQVVLSGAALTASGGTALLLEGAAVGQLWLRGAATIDGGVSLTDCDIGVLVVDPNGAVPAGRLVAHGWRIGSVHGAMASDGRLALRWLDTLPPGEPYSPQPARALAEVYEAGGHPDDARRLRYTAARRVAAQSPWRAKPWLYTYDALVGHGYQPMRTIGWLIVLLLVAVVLASTQRAMFLPSEPSQAAQAVTAGGGAQSGAADPPVTGATPCAQLGTYPCFLPLSYALQTVLPPAAAVESSPWAPTGWVLLAVTLLKGAGWVLTVLFLAGLTGLLRRT